MPQTHDKCCNILFLIIKFFMNWDLEIEKLCKYIFEDNLSYELNLKNFKRKLMRSSLKH
jgi:hypothetical protein